MGLFVSGAQRRAARKARQAGNPHYFAVEDDLDDVDDIPIVKLEIDDEEGTMQDAHPGRKLLSATGSEQPSRTGTPLKDDPPERPEVHIDRQGEMPEGSGQSTPNDRSGPSTRRKKTNGGLRALEIDVAMEEVDRSGPSVRAGYDDYEPDSPVKLDERIAAPPVEVVQVVAKKKKKKKRAVVAEEGGAGDD